MKISLIPRFVKNLTNYQAGSIRGGLDSVKTPSNSEHSFTSRRSEAESTEANWSTSLQTVLDEPPSTLPHKLILGGMAFCLAFGAWATIGQIDEVGHAQGRLVPKGEVYKIHPVALGKVAKLTVKEGQAVKAGQILVELDTTIDNNEIERLLQQLMASKTQISQTQAIVEQARLEAKTRAEIANAGSQEAKEAIMQAKDKAASARELLTQLQADATAAMNRVERLQPLTPVTQDLLQQRQLDAAASAERVARLKPLVEQGAVPKELLFQAEQGVRDRHLAITQSRLDEDTQTRQRLFEAEQGLRDRQRAITQNESDLQQALVEASKLQVGLIEKQAEGRTAQLQAQQRIQQLELELTQLQAKMAETQNMLNGATARLSQKVLYAPVDGFVSSLNIHNIGEVVQPGQTVAEMAPDNTPLVLSASLPNQEAGFVKPGMPVQIKFDAYPYQDYGVVSGSVVSVSPDTKLDKQLGTVYQVEVALARNAVTANHQTIKFKPGETATAEIIIRHRSILDILLDPIKKLQKGGIGL